MTSASSASARHHTGHRRDIQARIRNTGFCYYGSVNLPGMGTIPCSTDGIDVFSVVSCVRSSRAAISVFLGCFSGRSFTLSMFECHVRFERIFASKILTWAVAVTSLPGLLACRPWQAASGFVWRLRHSDCWEPFSTHQGTRTSPCFSATILLSEKILLPSYFYKNANEVLAPARELRFSVG